MHVRRFVRLLCASGAGCVAAGLLAVPASAHVTVDVNGAPMSFTAPPLIQAGRVFVPLRGIFERLGAAVDYQNGTITATGNGRAVMVRIGSTQATIDDRQETVDSAPFIVGATTYVPLRFISQALGAGVDYDSGNRIVSIQLQGQSQPASVAPASDDDYADVAPPPIPDYDQPEVTVSNDIWQPGYWAWGSYGYYWVPGTWVTPPQPDYLWTPGYWRQSGNRYAFSQGYWAPAVGFYGGVNYGAGYYGNGYSGGRWENGTFRYNTYVSHVNTAVVQNVYVDRTVVIVHNDAAAPRPSYNGGPHGVAAKPDPAQLNAARTRHLEMTPVQRRHVTEAAQDRRLLATVNHNHPPVLAVQHPLTPANPLPERVPVTPADRIAPRAPTESAPRPPAPPHPPAPAAPERERPVRVTPPQPAATQLRVAPGHTLAPIVAPTAVATPRVAPVAIPHAPVAPKPAATARASVKPEAPREHERRDGKDQPKSDGSPDASTSAK